MNTTPVLTDDQTRKLADKYASCPGIARGIHIAHAHATGRRPVELTPEFFSEFERIFGRFHQPKDRR